MFAISARERDMLEMLRELSAYERDFFTKTLETMYEMRAEHREGGPTRELFCYLPSFPMDSAVSSGTMTAPRIRVRDCPAAGRRTAVYRRCHRRAPGGYGHRASVTDMIK